MGSAVVTASDSVSQVKESSGRSPLTAGAPMVFQSGFHKALKFRQFMYSILGGLQGVDTPGSLKVTAQSPNSPSVTIAGGGLWMAGTTNSTNCQGLYYDNNFAGFGLQALAADSSHDRIDVLVYRLYDPDYDSAPTFPGSNAQLGDFEWIKGVAAASPARPTVPLDAMPLAAVYRPSGVSNIASNRITDLRPWAPNWATHSIYYNVLDYGARGDGVTDDSAAINAAITAAANAGGGIVLFPLTPGGSYYVASSILMPSNNVDLEGLIPNFGNTTGQGVTIIGASGIDVILFPTTLTVAGGSMAFRRLCVQGGANGMKSLDFMSYIVIEDCHFKSQTNAGIYIEGGIEEWTLRRVKFEGQTNYGWRHVNNHVGGSANTKAYMDKSSFHDVHCTGQGVSGWYIECLTSNTCTWYSPVINNTGQHGFYADTAADSWNFIDVNTENNGNTGKSAFTTGTISSGTNTLTLASGTGFANGDPIVVKGAGSFKDLITTVSSGGGTTSLVLAANASTSVTSVEVTNASYDDFSFNNTIGTPIAMTWIGGVFGPANSTIRYGIRGDLANEFTIIGCDVGRPVYVLDQLTILGGDPTVRQVNSITQTGFRSTMFAGPHTSSEFPWAMLASPPGQNFYLALRDSSDNGSGTYGKIEFILRNGNSILDITSDYGVTVTESIGYLQVNGAIKARNQLYPSTPGAALQTACSLWANSGAPNNSQGSNGDIYFRSDGGSLTTVYQKRSGSWIGIV